MSSSSRVHIIGRSRQQVRHVLSYLKRILKHFRTQYRVRNRLKIFFESSRGNATAHKWTRRFCYYCKHVRIIIRTTRLEFSQLQIHIHMLWKCIRSKQIKGEGHVHRWVFDKTQNYPRQNSRRIEKGHGHFTTLAGKFA